MKTTLSTNEFRALARIVKSFYETNSKIASSETSIQRLVKIAEQIPELSQKEVTTVTDTHVYSVWDRQEDFRYLGSVDKKSFAKL